MIIRIENKCKGSQYVQSLHDHISVTKCKNIEDLTEEISNVAKNLVNLTFVNISIEHPLHSIHVMKMLTSHLHVCSAIQKPNEQFFHKTKTNDIWGLYLIR